MYSGHIILLGCKIREGKWVEHIAQVGDESAYHFDGERKFATWKALKEMEDRT
jgi:hypothetical protein